MTDVAAILARWGASEAALIADTPTSRVIRVQLADGGTAVIKDLKQIGVEDELRGASFLAWREGHGCARLLAREGSTLLIEDAGEYSVLDHLNERGDEAATWVLAEAISALHAPLPRPAPLDLQPLAEQFASLLAKADADRALGVDSLFVEAAGVARALLDDQRDVRPLHGDLHHENLLLGERGWLAIDPKGLLGDPVYDAANLFYNPVDRDDLRRNEGRIGSMASLLARAFDRDVATVLRYALAHACLSASWHVEDGNAAKADRSLGVAAAVRSVLRAAT